MSVEYDQDKLDEIHRLVRENNRMLHSMRRSAWLGGILKFVMYAAFLLIPLYFYMEYIAPMLETTLNTLNQVQGASQNAQSQFSQYSEYLKQLQSLYGGGQ